MDAITLLKEDHKTVEKLFKRFEGLSEQPSKTKDEVVRKIIEELSIHAFIEETIFYPAIRNEIPDVAAIVLEGLEEHHAAKAILGELDGMTSEDERFDAKVKVLMENVRHHVKEEEKEMFPQVREAFGRSRLAEMGDAMEEAKKAAPTHPHPMAPDTPPANVLMAAPTKMIDLVVGPVRTVTTTVKRMIGVR